MELKKAKNDLGIIHIPIDIRDSCFIFNGHTEHLLWHFAQRIRETKKLATAKNKDGRSLNLWIIHPLRKASRGEGDALICTVA